MIPATPPQPQQVKKPKITPPNKGTATISPFLERYIVQNIPNVSPWVKDDICVHNTYKFETFVKVLVKQCMHEGSNADSESIFQQCLELAVGLCNGDQENLVRYLTD
ncbi:hypothetical protein FRC03_007191, partial [Tulasnella sp. 419]